MYEFENSDLKKAVEAIVASASKSLTQVEDEANKLMGYVIQLTKRRKVYDLYKVKGVLDICYASAYLYKLFVIPNKISTYFLLREKTVSLFDEANISKDIQDKIFQMCECHMGEDGLADFLIPQKGMPDDLFADAIYIMNLKGCHCEKATKCI